MFISVNNVSHRAGPKQILDSIDFRLERSRFVALLGHNGAGKSTLMRIISAELAPSLGSVDLDGKEVRSYRPNELAMRRAYLPQSSQLNFGFTVTEVALQGRYPHVRGFETDEDREIARQALSELGVANLAERLYPTLSSGERQRVQLARVLCQLWEFSGDEGVLVLLDEPATGLDLSHQFSALATMHDLTRRGATVIATMHDLNLAARYADQIIIMANGKILASGTPREVLTPENIAQAFEVDAKIETTDEGILNVRISPRESLVGVG